MTQFPKEIMVQKTYDQAVEEHDKDDYEEGSTQYNEAILALIGESIQPLMINSWKELKTKMPKGYEPVDQPDIDEDK